MNLNPGRMGVALALVLLLTATAFAGPKQEETQTFDGVEEVRINTISGDCIVKKGSTAQVIVEVVWSYRPHDSFEPEFRHSGEVLKLDENMYGSNSGHSTWTVTVPNGTEIRFNSASGGIAMENLEGDFSAETASGDIEIMDCQGVFDISSASGDIEATRSSGRLNFSVASGDVELSDCRGEFEVSTASGTIRADGVILDDQSQFSTASGRVLVSLGEAAAHDLHVSTASGRAVLDYAGNPIKGYFELSAKVRGGRISSPVEFEDEEQFRQWGDEYVRKWFTRDAEEPRIFVETASGSAVLKE